MNIRGFFSGRRRSARAAAAKAVVVDAESIPGECGIWGCKLTLRIHFDDGTTSEFTTKKRTIDLGGRVVTEGDILPVRYDAAGRTNVELDVDAIKAQAAGTDRAQKDQAIARAEAELDSSAPAATATGSAASFADSAGKRSVPGASGG
jgi:hypothetical protein